MSLFTIEIIRNISVNRCIRIQIYISSQIIFLIFISQEVLQAVNLNSTTLIVSLIECLN